MNERMRLPGLVVLLISAAGVALAHDEHAPHFDAPQHGGVVLEFHDEIHYELVANQEGKQLQVWLSDAHRRPLAASEVTDLVAEIGHPGNQVEQVDMRISDDGGCWVGAAQAAVWGQPGTFPICKDSAQRRRVLVRAGAGPRQRDPSRAGAPVCHR